MQKKREEKAQRKAEKKAAFLAKQAEEKRARQEARKIATMGEAPSTISVEVTGEESSVRCFVCDVPLVAGKNASKRQASGTVENPMCQVHVEEAQEKERLVALEKKHSRRDSISSLPVKPQSSLKRRRSTARRKSGASEGPAPNEQQTLAVLEIEIRTIAYFKIKAKMVKANEDVMNIGTELEELKSQIDDQKAASYVVVLIEFYLILSGKMIPLRSAPIAQFHWSLARMYRRIR